MSVFMFFHSGNHNIIFAELLHFFPFGYSDFIINIPNIEENNIKSLKEKLIDRNILFEQATKINKKEKELINKSKINIIKKEFEITKQKQLY